MNTIIILISLLCSFTVFSSVEPGQVIKAVQFNSSTAQLGEIKQSILTVSQFQSLNGSCWVLMDGQNIEGKALSSLTGLNNVPDARGLFLRSLDNGKGIDAGRVLGSIQAQATARPTTSFTGDTTSTGAHGHNVSNVQYGGSSSDDPANENSFASGLPGANSVRTNTIGNTTSGTHSHSLSITGGGDAETRPANIAVNYFIKVDNCE